MSYDWSDVFIGVSVDAEVTESAAEGAAEKKGWLKGVREGLSKSRKALGQQLASILLDRFDDEVWEKLEETLIYADVGVAATVKIVQSLEEAVDAGQITESGELLAKVREITADMLRADEHRIDVDHQPAVIVVCGVNGTGKTTTIGKVAWHLKELGKESILVAGDTFRAAASEQLEEWGRRAGCRVIRQKQGSDAGAVVHDGVAAGQSSGADVVIVDTAGRLHTQKNLMKELEKVVRVTQKLVPDGPHEVLLTLDATTGQNGLVQAKLFAESVDVSGVVLTKMDGTARGGIAIAVTQELGLPIKLMGVGEKVEDLRPFDPDGFSQVMFEEGVLGS